MSSIAGFFKPNTTYSKDNEFCIKTISDMSNRLRHRGPNEQSFYHFPHGAFSQNFLAAGSIPGAYPHEIEPVTIDFRGNRHALLFDGYITNPNEIAEDLKSLGFATAHYSLERLLLMSFLVNGPDFAKKIRGGYAIAIYDEGYRSLYLFRDPLGIRPLFYCQKEKTLVFASEIKGIFAYPGICPVLTEEGLTELLALGPARRPGSAILQGIAEVRPGHCLSFGRELFREDAFHRFSIQPHTDSTEETAYTVQKLLDRSFQNLMPSLLPPSAFLSGGLDSSIVSAKLAREKDTPLDTYSLEFENSGQFFRSNSFQPSLDAPFVQEMSAALKTRHRVVTCDNRSQFDYLKTSVCAHDLPAMADVDSSYLFFCEKVSRTHRVVFTGECADELFCGYPWYYRATPALGFPWSEDLSPRKCMLRDHLLATLPLAECAESACKETCQEIGLSADSENLLPEELQAKTFYLTLRYFMQTLLNRGDRAAAAFSMDARMPFADLDLAEYLFHVPLALQSKEKERKSLLRSYAVGLLPEDIRKRPKSPYPKTYDPGYETLLNTELLAQLSDPSCPLHAIIDKNKADIFCRQVKDLGQPWYGQLMAGPQLVAYCLQILYWIEEYQISLAF